MAELLLTQLLDEIRDCTLCEESLPLGANPVVQANEYARILIIGQAPGTRVHASGVPWNDPSGDRLRDWLGVTKPLFYNPEVFAIAPMGFCYPGKGKAGDLPPSPQCAPTWHKKLLDQLPKIRLTLLIGQYAQQYYLGKTDDAATTVTERCKNWRTYSSQQTKWPLPHPSPRNNIWLKKNPWFAENCLPELRKAISDLLKEDL